eukprot:3192596-Amphidinium_carterae.1
MPMKTFDIAQPTARIRDSDAFGGKWQGTSSSQLSDVVWGRRQGLRHHSSLRKRANTIAHTRGGSPQLQTMGWR